MNRERVVAPESSRSHRAPAAAREGTLGQAVRPPAYGVELADRPRGVQRRARSPEPADAQERQADGIAAAVAGEAGGASLPELVQAVAERTGASLGGVRFHRDGQAAARAADVDALAFTSGRDVYFGEGRFDPGSGAGRELIAHELVHAAQQQEGPERVQRFEAPKHQAAEMAGLTGPGRLTGEEAFDTYFGNWMRDLNQVFVPLIMEITGGNADFPTALLSYLGAKKFGREFQLEDFGYYIPAEHIDSPAGLVKKLDLLPQQPQLSDPALRPPVPAHPRGKLDTPQEEVAPGTKVLGADIFSADETGMISFLSRTLVHIERRLRLAVGEGRNPVGFMHLGAALHAVEDLFAHSNWIEIALTQVLREDPKLLPELKGAERRIFNFAPDVTVKGKGGRKERRTVLETGSFTGLDTKMSIGSELVKDLRTPYEPPKNEMEAHAEEKLTYVGLRTFHQRVASSPELHQLLTDVLVQQVHVPRKAAEWTAKRDPSKAYYGYMMVVDRIPWEWRVWFAKQVHAAMDKYVYQPLADRLEAEGLETKVADTSLLKNLDEAQRLTREGPSPAEEAQMAVIEKVGDEFGRKKSVADQKKALIDEQSVRLGDLGRTPAFAVAGPSHSMIAKDHSNSPFYGIAFKVARTAVGKVVDKAIDAWVEAHGEGARSPISAEVVKDPNPKARAEKEALAAVRRKEWGESEEYGEKVLEHGGDPKQSYDLAGHREASAHKVEQVAAALRVIDKSPEKADAVLQALGGGLQRLNPVWVQKIGQALSAGGEAAGREGGAAVKAAELEQLARDLTADAQLIRQSRSGPAREATYLKLLADRDRVLASLVTHPSASLAVRTMVMGVLEQQIRQSAVAWWSRQEKELAAAPEPKVEHVEMPSLAAEQKKTPALVALLQTTREVFSHPAVGSWWKPAVLEYAEKHRDILLANIEARNARWVVLPGEEH